MTIGNNGEILSVYIINYLLEKSRLCSPSEKERNFHIFYFLLKGLNIDDLK